MDLEKFGRQLKLMILLTQNHSYTIDDISQRLNMNRRSIYRYLDTLRSLGFVIKKERTRYRIDHTSPFFKEITENITFTEDEALTINTVLNSVYDNSPQVRHLRDKLASLYDSKVLANHGIDSRVAAHISNRFTAIREGRSVLLKGYQSPSSGSVSNRMVEPFQFMRNNAEVRCYEPASGMNKTFKVMRTKEVVVLDLLWEHKDEHRAFKTDLFHFSGEETKPVKLALGPLATSLLIEEFPGAEQQLKQMRGGKQLLETEVCNFKGVGRFVMGLYDDIEVLGCKEFQEYINERIRCMQPIA